MDKVDTLKQMLKNKKEQEQQKPMNPSQNSADATVSSHQKNSDTDSLESSEQKLNDLQLQLEDAQKKIKDEQDRYLRLYADFENYKKRVQKEKEDLTRYAQEKLAGDLLNVMDDFERMIHHAQSATEVKTLVDGVRLVEKQMTTFLEKAGITPLKTVGEIFDPNYHEAMGHQESADHPEDTVVNEYRKGYLIQGKLLRPALVAVAKKPAH